MGFLAFISRLRRVLANPLEKFCIKLRPMPAGDLDQLGQRRKQPLLAELILFLGRIKVRIAGRAREFKCRRRHF